jgi:small subunit ribosomal protein S1
LEGLLHISELSDQQVETPEDVVKVGDEIEVKVLRVDAKDRKIGLSRKNIRDASDSSHEGSASDSGQESASTSRQRSSGELRGGTGASGPLFSLPDSSERR